MTDTSSDTPADTFLYFGYGSNLLAERLRGPNPSARRKAIAKLQNYKLNFNYWNHHWHGAVATISQSVGDHVWGAVWELSMSDLSSLDDQEGVAHGIYRPMNISVTTPEGIQLICRTYQLLMLDSDDCRPSSRYKDVIVRGAIQNGLPEDYLSFLRSIEDNGYKGKVDVANVD